MPVILFVCTANQYRSPLAAEYTRRKLLSGERPEDWTVLSAGTWAIGGMPAHPSAKEAATALGLDLSSHVSREVDRSLMDAADLIIVMEPGHKEALGIEYPDCRERIVMLGELAGESDPELPDPARKRFSDGIAVSQMIVTYIDMGFDAMLNCALQRRCGGPGQPSKKSGGLISRFEA